MSSTPVPAAAEGMFTYPRNPHRFGFVRELLMRWGSRAKSSSINQTPVQESFMNQHVDRRVLLASSAFATAAVAVAAARDAQAAETSDNGALADLIAAKDAAYNRFIAAIDRQYEVENAYFAANPKDLLAPLSIGGAQTLYLHTDLDEAASDCQAEISKRYGAVKVMNGLGRIAPEIAEPARAALAKAERADLRNVKKMIKEERARRIAFGYEQASVELGASSDAERDALLAVCAYRCTSLDECRLKADYLLKVTGGRFSELQSDEVDALLQSFLPIEA